MRTLILTEKPDVARKIARALGKIRERGGYIEAGDGYLITWAFGHLFEIDTDKIAKYPWRWDFLPVIPDRFEYTPVSPAHRRQFEVIKKLLSRADRVIIATDAGMEGENIARKILRMARWTGWDRTYRLWTSEALTPSTVRKALSLLKPASAFDGLAFAARAREEADWLVGINGTRAVSIRMWEVFDRTGVWSVGRVQTPTLKLIVEREKEIENFKPRDYWIVTAKFRTRDGTVYHGRLLAGELEDPEQEEEEREEEEEEERSRSRFAIWKEEEVRRVLKALEGVKEGRVAFWESKRRREKPPLLHSLATLQREANSEFGFTADRVEMIAQTLYEKYDCISYPRSGANHLGDGDRELAKRVLEKLGYAHLVPSVDRVGKRVFDSSKLTDHHAIIPLAPLPERAKDEERKVYGLILRRFLGAFMPDYEYEVLKVLTEAGGFRFLTEERRDVRLGWKELYVSGKKEAKLLRVSRGEIVEVLSVSAEKEKTKPPPRYTDGSIIMKMKREGLGTEATRHQILTRLLHVGYVRRVRRQLVPTEKGRLLIERIGNAKIASVSLTSDWEKRLEEIRQGGFPLYRKFIEEITEFVRDLIVEIRNVNLSDVDERRKRKVEQTVRRKGRNRKTRKKRVVSRKRRR